MIKEKILNILQSINTHTVILESVQPTQELTRDNVSVASSQVPNSHKSYLESFAKAKLDELEE